MIDCLTQLRALTGCDFGLFLYTDEDDRLWGQMGYFKDMDTSMLPQRIESVPPEEVSASSIIATLSHAEGLDIAPGHTDAYDRLSGAGVYACCAYDITERIRIIVSDLWDAKG